MKKKFLSFLLLATGLLMSTTAWADLNIGTLADLKAFRDNVNNGTDYSGQTITLTADIDLSGEEWVPIGNVAHPFVGTFDGGNHKISGLTISAAVTGSEMGFFGTIAGTSNSNYANLASIWDGTNFTETPIAESNYTAVVKNLVLENVSLTNASDDKTTRMTGAVAGAVHHGYISNVTVSGSIQGTKGVGGITGCYVGGVIKNCINNAKVHATVYNVGGMAGYVNYGVYSDGGNTATIGCTNNGKISLDANNGEIGGILGWQQPSVTPNCMFIKDCTNNGELHANTAGTAWMGGILGCGWGQGGALVNCTNNGPLTSDGNIQYVAGIESANNFPLYNCTNNVNITISADILSAITIEYSGQKSNSSIPHDCTNNGKLTNLNAGGMVAESSISNRNAFINGQAKNFENVAALNSYISSMGGYNSITFTGVTVKNTTGTMVIPTSSSIYSIVSNTKLADAIDISGCTAQNLSVNVPNASITLSSDRAGSLTASGVNNTVTVNSGVTVGTLNVYSNGGTLVNNGTIGGLILSASTKTTGTNNSTISYVAFGGSGVHTFTNNGTISPDWQKYARHTISSQSPCTIFLNNYGTLGSQKSSSSAWYYTLLFYGNSNVVLNCYSTSVIYSDKTSWFVCNNGPSTHANQVTLNYEEGAKFSYNGSPTTEGATVFTPKSGLRFTVHKGIPASTNYVAQIGSSNYMSFDDAVAAANLVTDGTAQTIKLLESCSTGSDALTLSAKNVTINLNKNTLTLTNGLTISSENGVISNGTISGALTLNAASIVVNKVTLDAGLTVAGGSASLVNCEIAAGEANAVHATGNSAVSIMSGKYKNNETPALFLAETGSTISVAGGLFSKVPDYVASGYSVSDNTDAATSSEYPKTISVDMSAYVAVVNDQLFTDFATAVAAVDASHAGRTVTLLQNITLTSPVAINNDVTFNLNGFNITGNNASVANVKAGTLSITGSGVVSSNATSAVINLGNTAAGNAGLYVDADVTISTDAGYGVLASGSQTAEYITVLGKILVTSENSAIATAATDATPATVTINSGEVSASQNDAIYMPTGANLYVYGGAISGTRGIYVANATDITAGAITGTTGDALAVEHDKAAAFTVNITGGTLNCAGDALQVGAYVKNGVTTIADIYSNDNSLTIAEAYEWVETATYGTYKLTPKTFTINWYQGSQTKYYENQIKSVPEWEAVLNVEPNSVAVLDVSAAALDFANSTKNVIIKYSDNFYYCPDFELTDLSQWGNKNASTAAATDFYTPHSFTAAKVAYTRTYKTGYNAICLPFAITSSDYADQKVLAFNRFEAATNTVWFDYVTTVDAGTPFVVYYANGADKSFDLEDVEIVTAPATGQNSYGVFMTTTEYGKAVKGEDGAYYSVAADGKFGKLTNYLYPFRACLPLQGATPGYAAPRLAILSEEQVLNPTNLDELNDVATDMKFFMNGKLYIRHNGQLFDAAGQLVK